MSLNAVDYLRVLRSDAIAARIYRAAPATAKEAALYGVESGLNTWILSRIRVKYVYKEAALYGVESRVICPHVVIMRL